MQSLIKLINNFTGGLSAEVSASADAQKNLVVTQGNPAYMETRRRGESWAVMTATAPTALVDVPTTLAHLELYNNSLNKLLVINTLHIWRLLGSTVVETETLFAMITTEKAVPGTPALVLYSLSGKALRTPTVSQEIVTAVGTTVVANGWMPYGSPTASTLGAATPGTGQSIAIDGRLVVPPKCSLCLAGVSSVNTATCLQVGATFDVVVASMEP
jgi:hypothetical protein